MTDPHTLNLLLRLCMAIAAFFLLVLLVVALVPGLSRRYMSTLSPFTARLLHVIWWSSRVFYTWLKEATS